MATFTMPHVQGATGQTPGAWDLIVGANYGNCVFETDLAFVQAKSFSTFFDEMNGSGFGPLYTNTGLAPTDTISSIEFHIEHEWLDAVHHLPGVVVWFSQPGVDFAFLNETLPFNAAEQREDVITATLNPVTGVAWVYADLFTPGPFGGDYGAFWVIPDGTGTGSASSYRINQMWLVVNTVSAPTEVDIIGAGGVIVSGEAIDNRATATSGSGGVSIAGDQHVIAAGAGVPPELHGNQWGLLQFVMRSRLEDRL